MNTIRLEKVAADHYIFRIYFFNYEIKPATFRSIAGEAEEGEEVEVTSEQLTKLEEHAKPVGMVDGWELVRNDGEI